MKQVFILIAVAVMCASELSSQISAKLFRYPDVSATQIAFTYGGDIWVAPKSGGTAVRLSSPVGAEVFPKFSPDGESIAFTGNYDGNSDIYTIPSQGGIPTRVTHHGMNDRILDWYPSGEHLLYVSSSESGKQRFSQFYQVERNGGLPAKLPMAYGEFGSLSPDGQQIAFTDRTRVFRTWKRYRGGTTADIWIFDLKTYASKNITNNGANNELPMWVGGDIYYLSDAGANQRFNIWAYNVAEGKARQVTDFSDVDVLWPSHGPEDIVFTAGENLYLLNLSSGEFHPVELHVVSDMVSVKPKKEDVSDYVQSLDIAPDGKRVIVEARGEVFSLPAEKGFVQNLTRTSGVAERRPAWSPNGKFIAYWSDASGEYELTIKDMTQGGKEKQVSQLGPGFRYNLYWSPDSKMVTFVDQTMNFYVYHIEEQSIDRVDQDLTLFEGGLRNWTPSWSPDSRWLAYGRTMTNGNSAIFIYDVNEKSVHQATSGFYSDLNPTFGPEGDYLYIVTNRSFQPVYSDFDNSWSYPNATQLAVVTLRPDVASPLAPENDDVAVEEDKEEGEGDEESADEAKDEEGDEEEGVADVEITFDNFERRIIVLPPAAGNMGRLTAVEGKIMFMRFPQLRLRRQ